LDPDAREVLRLAKLAEQALPRDPERVRQRVLLSVGAVAASGLASHTATASAVAKTSGIVSGHAGLAGSWLPAVVKTVAVVSGLALAGGAAYRVREAHVRASAVHTNTVHANAGLKPVTAVVAVNAAPTGQPQAAPAPALVEASGAAASASPRPGATPPRARSLQEATRAGQPAVAEAEPSKRAAEAAAAPSAASPEAVDGSLSSDLRTLSAAQRALNAGQPVRALTVLNALRCNELAAERSALEVFAWCALGQTEVARQKAALFRAQAPSSPLLPRVNASCAKP
jgi:hypothetical protein